MTTGPEVADALAAEGTGIVLEDADGQKIPAKIRYSLDSLRALEREFGDLATLQDSFAKILANIGQPGAAHVIEPLVVFLAAGLRHVRYLNPDTGYIVRLGKDPDLVAELMDLSRLQSYTTAFGRAFGQAMGPTTPASDAAAAGPPSTGPGESGGTSPSTSDTSVPPTSGT